MKNMWEIEVEISCIENEIVQLRKTEPDMVTEEWLENMNSVIKSLKWVLDLETNSIDYRNKNNDYYGRFGSPS